ncbi:hypothetical protein ABW19_dt0205767 [Dactylella cylindrospora]|nr:hypothetical protein ABW19_dt0205767 [Dactylella cylindrospora]
MVGPKRLSHESYTIAWICALPIEMAVAKAMLDETHAQLPQNNSDRNTYTLGEIAERNVVIACLPSGSYGLTSAAVVAAQMLSSYPGIRFGLMVGIGGGVPGGSQADIRLGDVVVSKPTGTSAGVVQFDLGKTLGDGCFKRTGTLNKPPGVILTALSSLQANDLIEGSKIPLFLTKMVDKYPAMAAKFTYRGWEEDVLFEAEYDHPESLSSTCENCDKMKAIPRLERPTTAPFVHYGLIASANQVMKNGRVRDRLAKELGIICFEMEAAGLMDNFPCLVIRGICDYSDSHKNKQWQEYAAAAAAAYAKSLISVTSIVQTAKTPTAVQVTSHVVCDKSGVVQMMSLGKHMTFTQTPTYFLPQRIIATGERSQIDEVLCVLGGAETYARKQFFRRIMTRDDQVAIASFQNEVEIMKQIDHRHCVKLV